MAAAAIEPTWTTDFFRPTNRYRDLIRARHGDDSFELPNFHTEVELIPDMSPEHILAAGITWGDLFHFLLNKFVWMGPGVYVYRGCNHYFLYPLVLELGSSNFHGPCLYIYAATGSAAAATTATCDFAVRLLGTIKEEGASINGRFSEYSFSAPISGPGISRFIQESYAKLRKVTLKNMILNEEQIRALAATEFRPDMKVTLEGCQLLDDNGCHDAFIECFQRDNGPTQLISCRIDCHVLAAALEGNSSVTRFQLSPGDWRAHDAEMVVIFRSLAENKSLVHLDLFGVSISDENLTTLCLSLKGHPTLTTLDLQNTSPRSQYGTRARTELSDEQMAQRTSVVAEMMKENRVLRTITFNDIERDEQIYAETIQPYLETNRYRARVLAIKKADIALRRPLLGLALQTRSVRKKSNVLWMFLSGNADVVLQSNEDSEQVLEIAASAPVEVGASAQQEVAACAQDEAAATRKRKL
jgi:hypothetical protein